jgi:hypothetical protein
MKIARILAVCASLTIAFGVWTEVRAGTLPDISGKWYANGNPAAPCHIRQSGTSVSLTNEQGATATGSFVGPGTLSTDWGIVNGGHVTGTISNDLRTIRWSNGTYWSRPNTAPVVPPPTPARTPRPTPSPVPLRVRVMPIANNDSNPIYVSAASLTNGYRPFTAQQCVSYRNVTTKSATDVDFAFVVTNRRGGVEERFGWADKGTFAPPVNINNHCFSGWLPVPDVVRRMAYESIRVTQVTFADGTIWKPGMQFLRGYAVSGERLAQPTVQTTESAGTSGESEGGTPPGAYRLRTKFAGDASCLDIINDGRNNRLTMATCGDYTGQAWTIERIGATGYQRLRTEFTGSNKCLDIINDGRNNRLTMATCGDYTGQKWTIERIGATGYQRLRTEFTGSSKCLDIINDGRNNRLTMATCGDYSGQMWKLSHYSSTNWQSF